MKIPYSRAVALAGCITIIAQAAFAQMPVQNVDPQRHGNLAAAQELVAQAYQRVSDAQMANDDQLGGHAENAKQLLRQANQEIKLAAEAANRR